MTTITIPKTEKSGNFEKILQGQLIGLDGDEKIISRKNQEIIFAKDCKKMKKDLSFCGS